VLRTFACTLVALVKQSGAFISVKWGYSVLFWG
jgi:hypothetical protein